MTKDELQELLNKTKKRIGKERYSHDFTTIEKRDGVIYLLNEEGNVVAMMSEEAYKDLLTLGE